MAQTKIEASNIAAGAVASSGFNSVQVFTSGGTWSKPTDITKVIVEVQGAGGSGSRGDTGAKTMGAGGGGYAKKFLDVTNIDTVTVAVGTGGTTITTTGVGVAGGLSSFIKATGSGSFTDIVGNGGAAGTNAGYGSGVAGGTGTGGDINIQGGRGHVGGDGPVAGGSFLGTAGKNQEYGGPPAGDAAGYGAGGGGAYNQNSGVGGAGIIMVWEYK